MSNTIDWTVLAVKLDEAKMSWREIADMLGKPKSTVSDFLRRYNAEKSVAVANDGYDNSRILFISDQHIPYHHELMFDFLEMLKQKYQPTRIVNVGDELDKHAMSYHDSDPDLPSAGDELELSLPFIKRLETMFPEMDLVDSNHGSMHLRKAKTHGFSKRYMRSYNEILEVGSGWKWHNDLVLDMSKWGRPDVYVHHGKTKRAIMTSKAMSMSHVCGHYHESFGIEYWANPKGLYFGMNVGCLIDDKKLAFAYNKINPHRPIIGTGLIIEGVPVLEAMKL
jgi:transposase